MNRKELLEREKELKEQMNNVIKEQEKVRDELIRDDIGHCATLLGEMLDEIEAEDILEDIISVMDRYGDCDIEYKIIDCGKSYLNGRLMTEHCKSTYAFLIRDLDIDRVCMYDVVSFFEKESKERYFLKGDLQAERVCNVIYDWSVGER